MQLIESVQKIPVRWSSQEAFLEEVTWVEREECGLSNVLYGGGKAETGQMVLG